MLAQKKKPLHQPADAIKSHPGIQPIMISP
jgi:hypothetical protein